MSHPVYESKALIRGADLALVSSEVSQQALTTAFMNTAAKALTAAAAAGVEQVSSWVVIKVAVVKDLSAGSLKPCAEPFLSVAAETIDGLKFVGLSSLQGDAIFDAALTRCRLQVAMGIGAAEKMPKDLSDVVFNITFSVARKNQNPEAKSEAQRQA